MPNQSIVFKIFKNKVDFYNSEKPILPCWNCLVRPSCFNEKKAIKGQKNIVYFLRFSKPCIDSILAINYLFFGKYSLVTLLNQVQNIPTPDLFLKASNHILSENNINNNIEGFFLMMCVFKRDANYISYNYKTIYKCYFGTVYQAFGYFFHHTLKKVDFAIKFFSESIELTSKDSLIFEDRGFCYLKKNDFVRALNDLNVSLSNSGGHNPELKIIIEDAKKRQNGLRGNGKYDVYYEN